MSRMPEFNGLQVSLLALLPKDGEPVKVTALAEATATSHSGVIDALLDPFTAGDVIFDVRADTYSARRVGNDLPTERKAA